MEKGKTERRFLSNFKRGDVRRLLRELIRIPSHRDFDGQEKKIGEFIANWFEEKGVDVQLQEVKDGRSNVIARISGAGEAYSLMFNGHLDTVPASGMMNPFGSEVKGNKVYGRGACDMKGALAAMMSAMQVINESSVPLKGKLVFAGVIDEETSSLGTTHLIQNGPKTDFGIVGEPTNMKVAIAHKGALTLQITINGRAAHCDTPWLGTNAIEKMSKVIQTILGKAPRELERRKHKYIGSPKMHIGYITGGHPLPCTIIPDECKTIVLVGMLPGDKKESIISLFEGIIIKLQREDKEVKGKVEVLPLETMPEGYNLPFETSEDAFIVKAIRNCAKIILNSDPGITGFPYWCDASILSYAGIQTVIFGPGNEICGPHSDIEYIPTEDVINAAKIYALTALKVCNHERTQV